MSSNINHSHGFIRLGDLAHARSGDKGNRANIGVVANDAEAYAWLVEHLTAPTVADYFSGLQPGEVRRYELPNLHALNFVLDDALGGGASRSLRLDSQGKALGVALLELRLPWPDRSKGGK
ncbi:AtuA-related protein [Singulisphaera rosea]